MDDVESGTQVSEDRRDESGATQTPTTRTLPAPPRRTGVANPRRVRR